MNEKPEFLSPKNWHDYELIDCGNFEKLERFGTYFLIRPEPQAIWPKKLSNQEWEQKAHARFKRDKQQTSYRAGSETNGGWFFYKKMPNQWQIGYQLFSKKLQFKLALTSFGHVGIFPEQAENWEYIFNNLNNNPVKPKVLNLFAYTGGSTLAASAVGADVTHLDAVKQVVNWANENKQLSQLNDVRWLVEDALKFTRREVKREKKYQAIILDPPAYGRGPNGEKWVLEENLMELIENCSKILDQNSGLFVLNLYSLGFSSLLAKNLIAHFFPKTENLQFGEFYIQATTGKQLPLGTFLRFKINK